MWAPRRSRAAIASHSNFIRKFDLIRWTSWQKLPTSFSEFKSSPSDCRMGWNSLEGIQSKEGIIHGKSWFTIGEINAVRVLPQDSCEESEETLRNSSQVLYATKAFSTWDIVFWYWAPMTEGTAIRRSSFNKSDSQIQVERHLCLRETFLAPYLFTSTCKLLTSLPSP